MSFSELPQTLRMRILLWLVTPFPTYLSILFVYDLSDGVTRAAGGREATLSDNPELFGLAVMMCAVSCAVTALFWLAVVSNWNERALPAGLRNRPFLGTAFLIVLSCTAVLMSLQMLSGEITFSSRRAAALYGRSVTADATPIRYATVCLIYLGAFALLGLGWFVALKRWINPDYRWKPAFLDRLKRPPTD